MDPLWTEIEIKMGCLFVVDGLHQRLQVTKAWSATMASSKLTDEVDREM